MIKIVPSVHYIIHVVGISRINEMLLTPFTIHYSFQMATYLVFTFSDILIHGLELTLQAGDVVF